MPTRQRAGPGFAPGRGAALAIALAAVLAPATGAAQQPLSAIDWLTRNVETPVPPPPDLLSALPVPGAGLAPEDDAITVTPIDGPTTDAIGLLPAVRAGLPADLWGLTPSDRLAEALAALDPDTLPALRGLILSLLVAELDPPRDAEGRGALFLARLDRLMAFGAVDQALALAEAAGPGTPEIFARRFDAALLAGETTSACADLRGAPDLAPGPAALVYCLARGGDWDAAEATFVAALEAGRLTPVEADLLERFLDAESGHDAPPPPTAQPSPLLWALHDAIGEPLPTAGLPLAFAHADLSDGAGWRAQIEAAEQLTRAGVLAPNRLLGLYTQRRPAASGGVWDRAAAIQRLEAALLAEDAETVGDALPHVWSLMRDAELEVAFADLFAHRLRLLDLPAEAQALAFRAGLLTEAAAEIAAARPPADPREGFLVALATDSVAAGAATPYAMTEAIREAMLAPVPPDLAAMLAEDRRGEAILAALAQLQGGGWADPQVVASALATLRHAGQAAVARQAALQILLLDRRG